MRTAVRGIEEVIITARKTEESVQVVPVSVTALSAWRTREVRPCWSVQLTCAAACPGLFMAPNSQGGAPTFAIRAAKADNGTSDTVTAYIGDMPVASTRPSPTWSMTCSRSPC
jgi:iron complex outermembrane receptor protein